MEKINNIITELSSRFLERDEEIKGIMLSLMTREHCLFIGPPGTAKSALVEAVSTMSGLKYFRALVSKFTTPDELFGPPDIRELERGVYKRNTSGMLPEAEVLFIDEVFKASPSILNTLLSIMQERIFKNGATHKVPLVSMFGASNEIPEGEDDAALSAFSDRFLLKYEVKPISDDIKFMKLLEGGEPTDHLLTVIEKRDWEDVFTAVDNIKVGGEISVAMLDIKFRLGREEDAPFISDRRWRKCIKLLKANTALRGDSRVDIDEDFGILVNALWDPGVPGSRRAVERAVRAVADPISLRLQELQDAAEEVAREAYDAIGGDEETGKGLEAIKGLKRIMTELDGISTGTPGRVVKVEKLKGHVAALQKEVGERCLGIAL